MAGAPSGTALVSTVRATARIMSPWRGATTLVVATAAKASPPFEARLMKWQKGYHEEKDGYRVGSHAVG